MNETDFKLDMTMMYAFHDAVRRDLQRVAQMKHRSEGWDLFETLLRAHHTAEDDALWPVMREALGGRSDDVALVNEMESEHDLLDPLLEAIDEALTRGEAAPDARAEVAARLEEHLTHEEEAVLPLIDVTLTDEQWMRFGQVSTERVGPSMPRFLPWLLDGAGTERTERVLSRIPEPVQQTYRDEWWPAYSSKDWWAT